MKQPLGATSAAKPPGPSPASKPRKEFRLAWTLQTKPFNTGLAFSSRLVASVGTQSLALVNMRSGRLVKQRDVCPSSISGFSFVTDRVGALVCEQSVMLLRVPELTLLATHPLPGLARVVAFGKTHVAIAFEAGPVRLYALEDWSLAGELPVEHEVVSLAVSGDGEHLALGFDQGDVVLIDRAANEAHRVPVKIGLAVETTRFDRTGAHLFAGAGPAAVVWDVKRRKVVHRFRSVSNVLASAWIGASEIASVGRDGLLVLNIERDSATSLSGGLDGSEASVSIVVSDDGLVLCAAERDGRMACYARGKIPTRAIPTGDFGADDARMSGKVLGFVSLSEGSKRLTVQSNAHSQPPAAGTEVRVLRYTETIVGNVQDARWIEVSIGRVIKVKDGIVHLRVEGVLAAIPGVKDVLAYETPVRLVWKRDPADGPE